MRVRSRIAVAILAFGLGTLSGGQDAKNDKPKTKVSAAFSRAAIKALMTVVRTTNQQLIDAAMVDMDVAAVTDQEKLAATFIDMDAVAYTFERRANQAALEAALAPTPSQHGACIGEWIRGLRARCTEPAKGVCALARARAGAAVPMLLEIYHDGSQNEDSVTLCGVAGTESVWEKFKPKWQAALEKHAVKHSLFHMTDLMALGRSFSRRYGWDEAKRRSLLADLFNVVGSFRGESFHLVARSCTVLLADWHEAKRRLPSLPTPAAMCVNFCVGGLYLPKECSNEQKPVALYFDRDEEFMRTVRRVWERWKKRPGKFGQTSAIERASVKDYPIQLADLLAWIANRRSAHREQQLVDALEMKAMLMIKGHSLTCDLETILDHYPGGKLRAGAKG